MKKIFFGSLTTLLIVFCFALSLPVQAEEISDLTVYIDVNSDGSLAVREEISYDLGEVSRHGVSRSIPLKYAERGRNYSLRLDKFQVSDDKGQERSFTLSRSGDELAITIGEPGYQTGGRQKFVISYRARRALEHFSDRTELYWHVTGHDWELPIAQSRAEIRWPEPIPADLIDHQCFSGPFGSTRECVSRRLLYENSVDPIGISLVADHLPPGSGLTAVIGVPRSTISKPGFFRRALASAADNPILILPLFLILPAYYVWKKKGKDTSGL